MYNNYFLSIYIYNYYYYLFIDILFINTIIILLYCINIQ
jgi:hypothetical protein